MGLDFVFKECEHSLKRSCSLGCDEWKHKEIFKNQFLLVDDNLFRIMGGTFDKSKGKICISIGEWKKEWGFSYLKTIISSDKDSK